MRLFLIRHGQTEWNSVSRAQGHTDIELDATGLHQAGRLGKRFEGELVSGVLSSDLKRARVTAEAVADATRSGLEIVTELRERAFGEWEGKHFAELAAGFGASSKSRFELRPPGGESLHDVWDRIWPVTNRLLATEEPLVVVTHGATLSLLLTQMIKAPIEVSRAFRFANTGVTELSRLPDRTWHLSKYNDVRHLETVHELENTLVGSVDGASR